MRYIKPYSANFDSKGPNVLKSERLENIDWIESQIRNMAATNENEKEIKKLLNMYEAEIKKIVIDSERKSYELKVAELWDLISKSK
jgi:hypothetical protein